MPELPEVETIKRELEKRLKGKTISDIEVRWLKAITPTTLKNFHKLVIGKKIVRLERKAKMILIHLNQNTSLIIHLKMTGQLIFVPRSGQLIVGGHPTTSLDMPGRHTRLVFSFSDKSKLYFNDLRKFGWVKILDEKIKKYLETEVGLEPLSTDFTITNLKTAFKKYPNRTIKQILLDQKIIAGIGNIYADEICFLIGVLPWQKAKTLTDKKIVEIRKQTIAVLNKSLKYGGTSARDYVRSDGIPGGFAPHLMVYGRKNLPCKKCGSPILKIKHASRGTHYCQKCQK